MQFVKKDRIDKGWSGDQKYRVQTETGEVLLLRVSPYEQYERKARQFHRMQSVAALEIPMCRPLNFGECQEADFPDGRGVYSLQSWIDGDDAEAIIPTLTPEAQYTYGREAGRILRRIHTIQAPPEIEAWEKRFNRKIDRKMQMYADCPLKYDDDAAMLSYIQTHRCLLRDRPQCYQHGDYHIGNMMIGRDGKLYIIDFDRDDYGDPWEEFNRIVWCAQSAPVFASGMVDGYFEKEGVPIAFWELLALYICSNTLSSLPWAIPFGQTQIDVMQEQEKQVMAWYAGMTRVIPTWYQVPNAIPRVHHMRLHVVPYTKIAQGSKTIELRLYDEKRRALHVGDRIVFACADTKETLTATVRALHCFDDFASLYRALPLDRCGYSAQELPSVRPQDMEAYYTQEEIARWGVVGIELKDIVEST